MLERSDATHPSTGRGGFLVITRFLSIGRRATLCLLNGHPEASQAAIAVAEAGTCSRK